MHLVPQRLIFSVDINTPPQNHIFFILLIAVHIFFVYDIAY